MIEYKKQIYKVRFKVQYFVSLQFLPRYCFVSVHAQNMFLSNQLSVLGGKSVVCMCTIKAISSRNRNPIHSCHSSTNASTSHFSNLTESDSSREEETRKGSRNGDNEEIGVGMGKAFGKRPH